MIKMVARSVDLGATSLSKGLPLETAISESLRNIYVRTSRLDTA